MMSLELREASRRELQSALRRYEDRIERMEFRMARDTEYMRLKEQFYLVQIECRDAILDELRRRRERNE
jgi:hypothetical protein